jgi:pimeloyl-ACP methyl ester carboxylesterase
MNLVTLASGITLDVHDTGPREAPTVIFLHGFPESARAWRHQIAHLSPHYRCIAPDQRGYGASSRPAQIDAYRPEALVGDIFALADALGVERFALVGHDWGGVVAWMAAHTAPKRITRLAIANAPHPALFQRLLNTHADQRRAAAYITALRDPAIDADLAAHGLAPTLLRLFGKGALAAMEPEERNLLLARWQNGEAAQAMVNWYRASPIVVPAGDVPVTEPLPAPLPMPVQVIWGMEDRELLPACLDGLEDICPDLRIARLEGVGHFSPWAAGERVSEVLQGFLREE